MSLVELHFEVIIYQSRSNLKHTGVFVRYGNNKVGFAYDFGYWTLSASLPQFLADEPDLDFLRGRKYFHQSVIRYTWEQLNQARGQLIVLFRGVYSRSYIPGTCENCVIERLEAIYFLDSSFYLIPVNNCRHYVIRVLERLIGNRRPTYHEFLALKSINAIKRKIALAKCPFCNQQAI